MTMPVAPDPVAADVRSIRVTAAPVAELFWVLHDLACDKYHHEHPVFHDLALGRRAREMWDDQGAGDVCFDELLIIAASNDLLTTPDIDEFIDRVPALAFRAPERHPLATETELTRTVIYDRLDRLAGDAQLRATYQAVLRDVWAAVRDTWETEGQAMVERAVAGLRTRVAEGAELSSLLNPRHWALDRRFQGVAAQAAARGLTLLVPCYFGGHSLVFDLPDAYLIGIGVTTLPRAQQLRQQVQEGALRLKVLADPTRMAMLAYLSDSPATVTELARAFSIAQPTVSAHIRMLRDAHLVQPAPESGKTRYQVSVEQLDHLLDKVRKCVIGASADGTVDCDRPPSP